MMYNEPWSKRHKKITGGLPYNLSNSFAEPLNTAELVKLSLARGDIKIVDAYYNHSLVYTPNGGSLDIREEIAKLYGANINAENIVVFSGGQVALQTAAIALLDRDDHSIVFSPGYQSVQEAPLQAGSELTKIFLRPENRWQINPKDVEAAIRKNTKYMVINEPYNPAGTLMSHYKQEQLRDIAAKNDMYILSDEVYRLLEHDPKDQLPAMADFYDKGISAVSMSKPWGGCGITIGWLALRDLNLKKKISDVQYFGTACPSRASEILAIMALRANDIILRKNLEIIRYNLGLLDKFLEDYNEFFDWVRPNAGAIGFVKFKGPMSSDELGSLLARNGISIKPAYVFSLGDKEYSDYFRIGFGEKVMPEALDAFINFVEKQKHKWSK